MSSVTWTTQPDFENNASTTNTPTTRVSIDTTTVPGDVKIGIPKDLLSTATIINNTSNNKVYTIGAERNSVAVINATTKELLASIQLPSQPSGAVYNSANNKLYVGHYNSDKVSVIDCTTDTVIATVVVGNGANAALYNSTNNKVYIANMIDQTVSVLDGISDTVIATVPVVAGPYTAAYNLATNKVYLTNKFNNVVSIIDGASNQVEKSLEIEPVVSMLSGLRVTGIAPFDKAHLSWNYDELTAGQKIQFQVRIAQDPASLERALYLGPDGTADTWYDLTTPGANTATEGDGSKTTSLVLNTPYSPAAELRVKLSSSDMTTPVLHAVTMAYESYADLEITNVSGPSTGTIGSPITISSTVVNNGTEAATAFKIGIYLDDLKGTSCYLGERAVTSLAPKTPDTGSITVIIPTACKTGDYYLKAIADYTNLVVEGDETNNTKLGNNITISSVQPDLVVKSVSGTVSGGKLTYSVTIQNRGINAAGSYGNNFPTSVYLSSDATITTSDYLIYVSYSNIPGNSEVILTGAGPVPPNLPPGNYYIGAYADYTNQVPEFDETNNTLAGNQPYIHNDLIVTAVSATVANGKVTYSVTVKNVGNGAAGSYGNNFPTAIYLSSDAAITTSDYLINANWTNIPGNSEVTLTGTGLVPPNLPPGNYYVGAYADYTNQVPESDETNNTLAGNQPYIYNDLIVTAVSATVANGKVTYSVTVKNVGNGAAGSYGNNFPTAIYISSDAAITTSDYLIDANYANIPGNSEVILTGTRSVPPNLPPGNYYIGAYADYTNQVPESDETNNTLAGNPVIM